MARLSMTLCDLEGHFRCLKLFSKSLVWIYFVDYVLRILCIVYVQRLLLHTAVVRRPTASSDSCGLLIQTDRNLRQYFIASNQHAVVCMYFIEKKCQNRKIYQ